MVRSEHSGERRKEGKEGVVGKKTGGRRERWTRLNNSMR